MCIYFGVCVSGDFLSESSVYEDLLDVKGLKKFMETHLEDYNLTPGVVPMSLVLFRDAIEHSAYENTSYIPTQTHTLAIKQAAVCLPLSQYTVQ